MTTLKNIVLLPVAAATLMTPVCASAQSAINLSALKGLSAFSTLPNTTSGQAALASNYLVTGATQSGTARQPTLLPFKQQELQALRDAFITSGNALELADGLGSRLDAAYSSSATYTSTDDGASSTFASVSDNVTNLFAYAAGLTASDSGVAKFFFANETVSTKTGAVPPTPEAASVLTAIGGVTDVYGKAYRLPGGAPGADPFGDSRPFQTEKHVLKFTGPDYFGVASGNDAYLEGPAQSLVGSPAFPSGHTTYGYTESLLLAIMIPERYPQMIVRGAEYGNDRIIMGAHYAMDVMGGRTLAYYDVAHLLANAPAYVGQTEGKTTIADFPTSLAAAKADLRTALEGACGNTIAVCAQTDTSRFASADKDRAFYESTQTYGLATAFPTTASTEDVGTIAPEAGFLLTAAFPNLSLVSADKILTDTEDAGGGFLDNGTAFGVYSRLDLYKAGLAASTMAANLTDVP